MTTLRHYGIVVSQHCVATSRRSVAGVDVDVEHQTDRLLLLHLDAQREHAQKRLQGATRGRQRR